MSDEGKVDVEVREAAKDLPPAYSTVIAAARGYCTYLYELPKQSMGEDERFDLHTERGKILSAIEDVLADLATKENQ